MKQKFRLNKIYHKIDLTQYQSAKKIKNKIDTAQYHLQSFKHL